MYDTCVCMKNYCTLYIYMYVAYNCILYYTVVCIVQYNTWACTCNVDCAYCNVLYYTVLWDSIINSTQ